MFSKKSLRITLATVMLLGMVAMGLAYGAWSESLTINGLVKTGNLDVNIAAHSAVDNETGSKANLASCTLYQNAIDPEQLDFKIENAYPGYTCTLQAVISNVGSIPVKLGDDGIGIIVKNGLGEVVDKDIVGTYFDITDNTDGFPAAIADGGAFTLEATFTTRDGATQDANFSGTITLPFTQVQ